MTRRVKHTIARLLSLCTAVAACGFLLACGQKGPLMLPEPTESEIGQDTEESGEDQQESEDENASGN